MLLDCIVLLCQRRVIREELRKLHVYYVVKNLAPEVMENDEIFATIQNIVDFLMRDESFDDVSDGALVKAGTL